MAEIIKINDNTWRIDDDFVRFYLFCGSDKALLIDSGASTTNAREIAESLTDLPLFLINTHADRDHVAGNHAFDEVYMSPNEDKNFKRTGGQNKVIPVKEGDVIDLGDRPLKIIDIPGHTPGSIAILDEKNRVLVSGDTIQNSDIFMFGELRNIDDYIRSLEHMSEYEGTYDTIYPMHGSFPVTPDLIPKLIEGAKEVKAGTAEGMEVDLYGNKVNLYKFDYAGFFYIP